MPFCQTYLEKTDIIITNLSKGLMCNLRHSSASCIIMDGLERPAGTASAPPSPKTHRIRLLLCPGCWGQVSEGQSCWAATRENYYCQNWLPAIKGLNVTSKKPPFSDPEVVVFEAGFTLPLRQQILMAENIFVLPFYFLHLFHTLQFLHPLD